MRLAKRIGIPIAVLLAVGVAVLFGGGWYFADEIRNGALVPDHGESELDLIVSAVGDGTVTLDVTPETDMEGRWQLDGFTGLELKSGYHQIGTIIEKSDQSAKRELFVLDGVPAIGEKARVDNFAFPGDPLQAHGLAFQEVSFSSPVGEFPAWYVDGASKTWAIYVHGRSSTRREALRSLSAIAASGIPSLIITYRNDEGLPENPDGYHRFGLTEWRDLEAAANYALANGAESIVLVGYSMGGGIIMSFLYESPLASRVLGAVLDAPMLDFGATVDFRASRRGLPVVGLPLPRVLTATAKLIAGIRFDMDWDGMDYNARASELKVPVLLFHGDEDTVVPMSTSDALAGARPDMVEYVQVLGAAHVGSWNRDRDAYEAKLAAFLQRIIK